MPYYRQDDDADEDEDDWEEDELAGEAASDKDAVLICIDASTSMQTLRSADEVDLDDAHGQTSFFAGALDCAFQLEKRKAFVSPADYVGILIYNTTKYMDEHPEAEESGIYVLHTLAPIDVDRCKALKDLVEKSKSDPKAFQEEFPPLRPDDSNWVTPAMLLNEANQQIRHSNIKKGNRRVFLITDDDDPCAAKTAREAETASQVPLTPRKRRQRARNEADEVGDIEKTRDRMGDFMQLGADVIPFFLSTEQHQFDPSKFWEPAMIRSFASEDQGTTASGGLTAFKDLLSGLAVRQSSKRSMWTLPLTIAEDVVIGVKGFALIMEAKKPSTKAFNFEGEQPVEVQRQTTYYDQAGAILQPSTYAEQLRFVFQNGVAGGEEPPAELREQEQQGVQGQSMDVDEEGASEREELQVKQEAGESKANEFDLAWGAPLRKVQEKAPEPPRVTYTRAEIAQIGTCGLKPGIRVLGYQSKSCVSFERNVKSPYFLRPTEDVHTLGSTRTFVAFMRSMLDRDLVAIALCMFRRRSSPEICALVPQAETFIPAGDVNGSQDKPPGIHVIRFPFLDDMREYPAKLQEAGGFIPDQQHVSIMQKVIKKLTARAGYNPEDIPNPTLARYFAELEARAFEEDFDGEKIEDRSLPVTDEMKKRVGDLLIQFKKSVGADERAFMTVPRESKKRAVDDEGVLTTKRQKATTEEDEPDLADVRKSWKAGSLAKDFTVKQLKPFLRHHAGGQIMNLKKAELVAAVQEYFVKSEM